MAPHRLCMQVHFLRFCVYQASACQNGVFAVIMSSTQLSIPLVVFGSEILRICLVSYPSCHPG